MRHGVPVIAVVGNDASWTQIAREQVKMLNDDVGTVLARSDYHAVAQGLGAAGLVVRNMGEVEPALREAREIARQWPAGAGQRVARPHRLPRGLDLDVNRAPVPCAVASCCPGALRIQLPA